MIENHYWAGSLRIIASRPQFPFAFFELRNQDISGLLNRVDRRTEAGKWVLVVPGSKEMVTRGGDVSVFGKCLRGCERDRSSLESMRSMARPPIDEDTDYGDSEDEEDLDEYEDPEGGEDSDEEDFEDSQEVMEMQRLIFEDIRER